MAFKTPTLLVASAALLTVAACTPPGGNPEDLRRTRTGAAVAAAHVERREVRHVHVQARLVEGKADQPVGLERAHQGPAAVQDGPPFLANVTG